MDGTITVTYKILCENDFNYELTIKALLENEKIAKAIKSEFAKGVRNISLDSEELDAKISINSIKEKSSIHLKFKKMILLIFWYLQKRMQRVRSFLKKSVTELNL